jgi:hypothetical protein
VSYQDQMLMELNDRLEKAEAERDALKAALEGLLPRVEEWLRLIESEWGTGDPTDPPELVAAHQALEKAT